MESRSPNTDRDAQETAARGVQVLLLVYETAAEQRIAEAEELICRALELRDEAVAILNRARRIAEGHAKKYPEPLPPRLPEYEEPDW